METVFCKIKRFDGTKEWYQEYKVPYEKGKTVIWLLTKIREEQDPTLNFSVSCLHAICGACGVKINGSTYLTCNTTLDSVLDTFNTNKLLFEPMANFEVVRDLVVNFEPKINKMKEVQPWLKPTQEGSIKTGFKQSDKEFKKISSSIDCILCGVCSSECQQMSHNEENSFYDPFIFNKAYRFAADTRDNGAEERIEASIKGDLWKCVHCMRCSASCPKGIDINNKISCLRSGNSC